MQVNKKKRNFRIYREINTPSLNKKNGDTFDMGDAAGRFAYIEDPDGTLIEFVETHKLPVIKKMGINIDLRKRKREKALPRFLLGFLKMNRVKIQ